MKDSAIDILRRCMDELNNTSKDEFDIKRRELGLNNREYDYSNYECKDFEILFEVDRTSVELKNDEFCYNKSSKLLIIVEDTDRYIAKKDLDVNNNFYKNKNDEIETLILAA